MEDPVSNTTVKGWGGVALFVVEVVEVQAVGPGASMIHGEEWRLRDEEAAKGIAERLASLPLVKDKAVPGFRDEFQRRQSGIR